MNVNITERRIDHKVRYMRFAAVLCACFAAIGIAIGIHEANLASGWLVPALAGAVAAAALAVFWHVAIGSVTGMVRRSMIITLFAISAIVTAVALGASAQAIATAVAGRSALAAELSARVDDFNVALAEAYAQATGWGSIASAALAKATGYELQAKTETTGDNGTGKGCGPRCASLRDISGAFAASAEALNSLIAHASAEREKGEATMTMLRDAASNGDQISFIRADEEISSAIARLNGIDPRPIIENTGAVVVSAKGIDQSRETKDFYAIADKALAGRKTVNAPVFVPMSLGEATRHQAFGSALHGWVLAGAIDVLPLFFLVLAFLLSREVWLNEAVVRRKPTKESRDIADREALESMMGKRPSPPQDIHFMEAAE
jgi:hypothetical protein